MLLAKLSSEWSHARGERHTDPTGMRGGVNNGWCANLTSRAQ